MNLPIILQIAVAAGAWTSAPPMQHARAAHNVVATDKAIYALAGPGVTDVEMFDGKAWRVIAQMPDELNAPGSAIVGNKLYLIGGFSRRTNQPTDRVWIYDLKQNTWSEGAPLPSARGGFGIAVLKGEIHVLGGGNSERTLNDHSVYNPRLDKWSERAPLERAQGSPAIVEYKGELWAIGGRSGFSDFGDVDIYNPASDSWLAGPSISPRGTVGAVVYQGAIHIFGGEIQETQSVTAEHLRLDPKTQEWQKLPPMPTARNYARAVVFKGAVYVVGGSPSAGASHSASGTKIVERYME